MVMQETLSSSMRRTSSWNVSTDHLLVFSNGSARNGYHQAAAVSETVSGVVISVNIVTSCPASSNLMPVLRPETPAPIIEISITLSDPSIGCRSENNLMSIPPFGWTCPRSRGQQRGGGVLRSTREFSEKGPRLNQVRRGFPLVRHAANGACKEMESGTSFFVASVARFYDSLRQYAKPNSDYCRCDEKPHRGQ